MSSESVEAHRQAAEQALDESPGRRARGAVLTVSDSRTLETDEGGRRIVEAIGEAGYTVADRRLVPDEASEIDRVLGEWLEGGAAGKIDLIVTTGGTGIAPRDTTIEVVERRLDKRLDGFGELFRMLSWGEVGSAAMLSRAVAGLAGETFLFALPGSPAAVSLGLEKLIVPELDHLIWERRR